MTETNAEREARRVFVALDAYSGQSLGYPILYGVFNTEEEAKAVLGKKGDSPEVVECVIGEKYDAD